MSPVCRIFALTKSNFAGRLGKLAGDLGAKEIKYIGFGQDTTQPLLPTGTLEIPIYFVESFEVSQIKSLFSTVRY